MEGPALDKLGTIELRFYRCVKVGEYWREPHAAGDIGRGQVHERTKKAGAHTVV